MGLADRDTVRFYVGIDVALKPDKVAVSTMIFRNGGFEIINVCTPPVIYFSSAWTGIISREERQHKDIHMLVERLFSRIVEKRLEKSIWAALTGSATH